MNPIAILFISILAALIGALPFGLVNLTITYLEGGNRGYLLCNFIKKI